MGVDAIAAPLPRREPGRTLPSARRWGRWSCLLGAACLGVAALGAACDGQIGDAGGPGGGGSIGGSSTGAGGAGSAGVGRNLRRLSVREYNNVVRDLLGDTTQPADQFGQEVYTNGFDNGWTNVLLLDNFIPLVGYLLPWAILAYYFMKYREIANPS